MRRYFFLLSALFYSVPSWALNDAVEFYHSGLDHYFVSSNLQEISDLDSGAHSGWVRTGQRFSVIESGDRVPGTSPVCRFYGLPAAGLDSHFYSASAVECEEVRLKFAGQWQLESQEVFRVYPADEGSGSCPAGTSPIYRLWNNRKDSNHRYTSDLGIFNQMVARGYVPEGYGNGAAPVAFCAPAGASGVPHCTVTADNPNPLVNTTVTLTAHCDNNPTSFQWSSNCTPNGSTCVAASSSSGARTYSVSAGNASGLSSQAFVNVTWQDVPPPPVILPPPNSANCSLYPDRRLVQVPYGSRPTYPYDYGGFRAAELLMIEVMIPVGTYSVNTFSATVAEYQGPPTYRYVSLSKTPCDFRPVDSTGANGPLMIGGGNAATVTANMGVMQPGVKYYINIVNWVPGFGPSCGTSNCDAIVGYQWPR